MATIYRATSPLARCRACGVQLQFHSDNGIPHAHERDHPFVAETIDDIEPADMDVEQLVKQISRCQDEARVEVCRDVLRAEVRRRLGVDWDELVECVS